jgi:hypothetical protein
MTYMSWLMMIIQFLYKRMSIYKWRGALESSSKKREEAPFHL